MVTDTSSNQAVHTMHESSQEFHFTSHEINESIYQVLMSATVCHSSAPRGNTRHLGGQYPSHFPWFGPIVTDIFLSAEKPLSFTL